MYICNRNSILSLSYCAPTRRKQVRVEVLHHSELSFHSWALWFHFHLLWQIKMWFFSFFCDTRYWVGFYKSSQKTAIIWYLKRTWKIIWPRWLSCSLQREFINIVPVKHNLQTCKKRHSNCIYTFTCDFHWDSNSVIIYEN